MMRASSATIAQHVRVDRGRVARVLLLAVPLAFLGVFFVYPVASIIGRGLTPGGTLDLSPIGAVVTDSQLRGVAWFTIWQATVSTALTVLVALPGAYVFARYEFRGKRLVRAAVLVPFVLPTVVVGSAFLVAARRGGPARVPRSRPVAGRHPRRPRVLQLRGRGADRRWSVGAPRSAAGRRGARPRRRSLADIPLGDAAGAPTRDRGRRRDRVPVHVHVVRGDPDPRRAELLDARDRDLPPDGAVPRPAAGRRALDRAAGGGLRRAAGRGPRARPPRDWRCACAPARRRPVGLALLASAPSLASTSR